MASGSQSTSNAENGELPEAKRPRLTSKVWNDFEKLESQNNEEMKVRCNSASSKNETPHWKHHLKKCSNRVHHDIRQSMISSDASTDDTLSLKNLKYDQEFARREMARMVVLDEKPFRSVEGIGFKRFMKALNPQFKVVSQRTIMRDIMSFYMKEKENMRDLLGMAPGRICMTAATWSSLKDDHFLCVTAHFIDNDWLLQKRILGFKMLTPPYDNGWSIFDEIDFCMSEWNIEEKVYSITLENANVNDVLASSLRFRLLRKKTFFPCDGIFFQFRCCAHILNLIVQAGMDLIDDVIKKIRHGIKYLKHSPSKKRNFQNIALSLNLDVKRRLCTDCPTRWNATYLMLKCAVYYKNAFIHLAERDHNFCMELSQDEWDKVCALHKFLKVFYDVTCMFSGTRYPTSNLYFKGVWRIHCRLLEVVRGQNNFMTDMGKEMLVKFDEYWSDYNLMLSCAAILDPRCKVKFVEYCFTKLYGSSSDQYVSNIVATIYDLFDEYTKASTKGATTSVTSVVGTKVINDSEDADEFEDYESFQSIRSKTQQEKSQLDLYLEEPSPDLNSELDVLEYWKTCSMRYPDLSIMARDILTIPISTVASEYAFSTGRRVLSPFRTSLKPKTIEALICLQDWMRQQDRTGKSGALHSHDEEEEEEEEEEEDEDEDEDEDGEGWVSCDED